MTSKKSTSDSMPLKCSSAWISKGKKQKNGTTIKRMEESIELWSTRFKTSSFSSPSVLQPLPHQEKQSVVPGTQQRSVKIGIEVGILLRVKNALAIKATECPWWGVFMWRKHLCEVCKAGLSDSSWENGYGNRVVSTTSAWVEPFLTLFENVSVIKAFALFKRYFEKYQINNLMMRQVWWYTTLIPAHWRERQRGRKIPVSWSPAWSTEWLQGQTDRTLSRETLS